MLNLNLVFDRTVIAQKSDFFYLISLIFVDNLLIIRIHYLHGTQKELGVTWDVDLYGELLKIGGGKER